MRTTATGHPGDARDAGATRAQRERDGASVTMRSREGQMPTTQLNLHGRSEVVIDYRPRDVLCTSPIDQAFFCRHHWSVTRTSVAAAVWPESTEDRICGSQRDAICRLGNSR